MNKNQKGSSPEIIIAVVAIIIIIILAGLLYYFATKQEPVVPVVQHVNTKVVTGSNDTNVPKAPSTNVIDFSAPQVASTAQKDGSCFASSIAQPFRKDAWRCMVQNAIFDPCFETLDKTVVYCQMNPLKPDFTLIKLTKALPKPENPATIQSNWAWFLTLKDGTFCSPFTGTRPFFGKGKDAQVAYCGCSSKDPNQQVVLLGDLKEDVVWTANKAILEKTGTNWTIKTTEQAEIDTVWK